MEEIRKVDDNTVEIVEQQKVVPETVVSTKTLDELESDLKQAQDSLVYIQARHADEISPIQATIDILQKRVEDAKKLGVVGKPIEVKVKEEIL